MAALGIGPDPETLRPEWDAYVGRVLDDATLVVPESTWRPTGGRQGLHTEPFGYMLAEMQHLHRSFPGVHVVTAIDEIRRVAGAIPDPEMPALTIADLGILRDVRVDASGHVDVDITPTYSGCPALDTIREDVERCVRDQGYADVTVRIVLSPAWTTEWMSEAGPGQAPRVRHRAAASARLRRARR